MLISQFIVTEKKKQLIVNKLLGFLRSGLTIALFFEAEKWLISRAPERDKWAQDLDMMFCQMNINMCDT